MSKNFEVLLRAEQETELFTPVAIAQEIPEYGHTPVHIDPAVHEEEVKLVQRVFLLPGCGAPHIVVFCAVEHADGAAGICARAAENLARQTTSRVCVIDANFHSPFLHHYFAVDNRRGFSNAVLEAGPIGEFVCRIPGSNLSLLPAGSRCGDAPAIWQSEQLRTRVAELREEFPYVLFYGPPAISQIDSTLLGRFADGAIVVVESGVTRRETARKVTKSMAAANVRILGAVMNNRTFPIPEYLYRKL